VIPHGDGIAIWKTPESFGSDDPIVEREDDEEGDGNHLCFSGYRWGPAHRLVGSSWSQAEATNFKLELAKTEDWHHLTFDTYEEGKLTTEEYLGQVVFYRERPFTRAQFRRFMFAQSKPYPDMIELVAQLKVRRGLKVGVVNNEAHELNAYRIRRSKLDGFVDFFVSSCLVHFPKPIFRIALDIAQTPARNVVYIAPMFVQIAEGLGIRSILYIDYRSTCVKLASFGLQNGERVIHETS
jgi:putative hydrolase of the HAD superfamily